MIPIIKFLFILVCLIIMEHELMQYLLFMLIPSYCKLSQLEINLNVSLKITKIFIVFKNSNI